MAAPAQTPVVYTVDANDFVTSVNPQWNVFALENQAPHLRPEAVIGTNLWTHIAEPTTRYLYRALLHQVRTTNEPASLSFRCDSPEQRRFTELVMSHQSDGIVQFECRVLKQELRLAVTLLDMRLPRSDEQVTMCSWCKKMAAPDWMDVEAAISALRLFEKDPPPQITHGICDRCQNVLLEQLARIAPAAGNSVIRDS